MELQTAVQIIETLAQGIDPTTGNVLPEDSMYNRPPIIRALFAVAQALQPVLVQQEKEERKRADGQTLHPNLPYNTGKAWTEESDGRLLSLYKAEVPIKDIAVTLGRTRWAIEARLVKLGIMTLGGAPVVKGGN